MKLQRLKRVAQATGIITGLIVVGMAVGSLFNLNGNNAGAADCSTNAIVKCGASSPSDLMSKVQSGNGATQNDLQTIYAAYGLSASEYSRFVSSAKAGTAYKDGRIVVDGKTVATDAYSLGRVQKNGDHAKAIGGTTYWEGSNQTAFASDSIPVWVLLDANGTMEFAVLGDCGNPMGGKVTPPPAPTPTAACTGLTATADNRTTFTMNASATTSGGATISGYNFVVQNGSGQTVTSKNVASTTNSASTQVTVDQPGTYTGMVTISTSLGPVTSNTCKAQFTVTPPPVQPDASCKQLDVMGLDRTNYKMTATASVAGGATVSGYDFVVKNASGTTVATPSVNTSALTASANATIEEAGTYTTQVTVRTSVGAKTGADCKAQFTIPEKPVPPVPSITIVKDVDGVKQKQVNVGQNFVYHVTVKNDGKVDLKNTVVTDQPPAGVTLLGTDKGSVSGNNWSYTIPSLQIGQSITFALTAKVDAYVAGNLVNTSCVDTPEVPGDKICDTATVTVTPPPTPTPVQPPVLPNTGASNAAGVAGIFLGVVATGVVVYRFLVSYKYIVGSTRR